jgi:antitoxin (DNA-binding transcriptional repressor) of toxin-antitoxin stability system
MCAKKVHMSRPITKVATVRDLRNNFAKLESWLAAGERIEIRRRGRPVATLTPSAKGAAAGAVVLPDFRARRKAIWGDRVFSKEEVERMNEMEREGDEG